MNRRKYLLSTLSMSAGLSLVSMYNTKPVISTDININSIQKPDIDEKKQSIKFNYN